MFLWQIKVDVESRLELRERLQCRDFKWYIDNIYPALFLPQKALEHGTVSFLRYTGIHNILSSNFEYDAKGIHPIKLSSNFENDAKGIHPKILSPNLECKGDTPHKIVTKPRI